MADATKIDRLRQLLTSVREGTTDAAGRDPALSDMEAAAAALSTDEVTAVIEEVFTDGAVLSLSDFRGAAVEENARQFLKRLLLASRHDKPQ